MTDQENDVRPEDLARLRLQAYSRSGTADDRRRLRRAEAAASPRAAPPNQVRGDVANEAATEPDVLGRGTSTLELATSDRRKQTEPIWRRRPVIALASLLLGAALASALSWGLGSSSATSDQRARSTEIFDVPADDSDVIDDPRMMLPIEVADSRLIGSFDGAPVFAVLATSDGSPTVCLYVTGTASACANAETFASDGIDLGIGEQWLRWGPVGPQLWTGGPPPATSSEVACPSCAGSE